VRDLPRAGFLKIQGAELSATYAHGPISAYANGSVQKAQGRDIVSSQFNFDPADLDYISKHYIYLDHKHPVNPTLKVPAAPPAEKPYSRNSMAVVRP